MTPATRPQALRSREAILQSAVELIATEGTRAVTHQRVAEHSGIGRATVYRHFPQLSDLLNDALARTNLWFLEPGPGRLTERLESELRRIAEDLNTLPVTTTAAAMLDRAQHDPDARQVRDRLAQHVQKNIAAALAQAVADGELHSAPAAEDLFDLLLGPLFGRRLISGAPITEELLHRVLTDCLAPWLARN